MNLRNIADMRLLTQQIDTTTFTTPKQIVEWMGAMQAQDYRMAKWAIGLRLPGKTDALIEDSFNKGEILRTHVLRPTWHFVAAEDIHWMLELSAPHLNRTMKSRHKQLGIDDKILAKSNSIIQKALEHGKHLTRPEIMRELNKHTIETHDLRGIHLMFHAELNGIVCSGMMKGKEHTYALLEKRVKKRKACNKRRSSYKACPTIF